MNRMDQFHVGVFDSLGDLENVVFDADFQLEAFNLTDLLEAMVQPGRKRRNRTMVKYLHLLMKESLVTLGLCRNTSKHDL